MFFAMVPPARCLPALFLSYWLQEPQKEAHGRSDQEHFVGGISGGNWVCATRSNAPPVEFPSYGWPRITAELKRHECEDNRKRAYRIIREGNLLAEIGGHDRFPSLSARFMQTEGRGDRDPFWLDYGNEKHRSKSLSAETQQRATKSRNLSHQQKRTTCLF